MLPKTEGGYLQNLQICIRGTKFESFIFTWTYIKAKDVSEPSSSDFIKYLIRPVSLG